MSVLSIELLSAKLVWRFVSFFAGCVVSAGRKADYLEWLHNEQGPGDPSSVFVGHDVRLRTNAGASFLFVSFPFPLMLLFFAGGGGGGGWWWLSCYFCLLLRDRRQHPQRFCPAAADSAAAAAAWVLSTVVLKKPLRLLLAAAQVVG